MKHGSVRTGYIISLVFCIAIFLILSGESVTADSVRTIRVDSERTIRVAQIDLSNFYDYDRYGPIGGYGFEYLIKISHDTGWNYDFVPVTREHGLQMLESGEIDLLAPAERDPELEKRFDFSDREAGLNYSVLCVAAEDTETAANDYAAMDGMHVGVMEDLFERESLESFTQRNHFTVEIIPFKNQAAQLKALHDNKLDAILTTSLEKRPTERIIAKFNPTPYYFITAKGNRSVMEPLNAALNEIKDSNPYYDYELQLKYYNDFNTSSVPVFTKAEKEFIKNEGIIRVVYDPSYAPIEFFDEKTGKFSGINADILELISSKTGLRFSFINTDSYTDALNAISNYQAQILTAIDNDAQWADQHNLMLTDSFLSASIVLVKNNHVLNLQSAKIALTKDYLASTEYVKRTGPKADILYFDTPLECFEAVNKGVADITYANSYVAERLMEFPRLNNLSIVKTMNLSDNLCIGVSDAMDPLLLSILNKAIQSISDTQLNSIIFSHTVNHQPEFNLEYLLYKNPGDLIKIMVGVFLAITAVLILIIITKNYHSKEIRKAAFTDSVTGAWNYYKFKLDAHALLRNAKNKRYAIVFIDIYRFSYINDTFGYYSGDLILTEISRMLSKMTREGECSARMSADNFVCLLEYEDDESMVARARMFKQQCEEQLSRINNRFKLQFTSAVYKITRGETDIPSLVGKANIAHKTIGNVHSSAIVFYDEKIQSEFLRKKKLESAMASSLKNGDFLIHLQPKIDLANGQIVGTEALARWQHPTEGLIMPADFIPLFESNGFILELDFYVYETVCRLIRKWIDAGESVKPVSVNVSKAHLSNAQFASQLKALIVRYQIDPVLFELELTESILFDTLEADTMIRELKSLGFSILIDDFGSGYSSLNLLKDLTVDVLKLDKGFFRKGCMGEKDKIIVDGIIRIANDLNLKILSEGVESQEQVDFLRAAGCHMAQGYHFARPMPVEVFEEMAGYQI